MQEPIKILKTALEELTIFTNSDASHLALGENGRLIAVKTNLLHRMVAFLGLLLSDPEHREQEVRIKQLKERIVRLREIIQTHYPLLETFQKGTESQRKFAAFALKTIQRYNDIVIKPTHSKIKKLNLYEEERHRLLLDKEITGHPIVSHQIKVGFDFPTSINPVQQMLKRLKDPLSQREEGLSSALCPIYKKNSQFIIDVFKVKSRAMIKNKFSQEKAPSNYLKIVEGEIEMREGREKGQIQIEQPIKELVSGSIFILTARFQLPLHLESKFMPIPTLLELKWQEDKACLGNANEMNASPEF